MRHQKKRHKIGRGHAHRKATLKALSTALIRHKRITTTIPKAKALRTFIEPIITRSREDSTHNRRQAFRHLQDKLIVKELFDEVGPQVGDRPGGYTRVVRLGRRAGDGAELAMIELVDYNDVQPEGGASGRKRTRRGGGKGRRRRGGKGQGQETTQPSTQAASEQESETVAAGQVETADAATETVQEPVAEAQETPVEERTEPAVEAENVPAAEEAIEAQEAEAEKADAPAAESTDEPKAESGADEEADEEKK